MEMLQNFITEKWTNEALGCHKTLVIVIIEGWHVLIKTNFIEFFNLSLFM